MKAGTQAMPRIAFIGSLLTPGGSGVERAVRELLKAYRKSCDVRVYCAPRETKANKRQSSLGKLFRIFREQIILPFALLRDRPDMAVAPAYVAPVLSHVPVILYVYDLHVFTHPETCTFANRLHYRALMPLSLRRAKTIVVPSARVRDAIAERFSGVVDKVRVVPLGVDRERFAPADDAAFRERARTLSTRHGLPDRFALFVGNIAPRKNLAAIAGDGALPMPLVVAGRCDGEKPEGAIALGRVSDEEIIDLYRMAFALVHPAIDEGFGLTVLEAMACGCPVVASPNIAPELIPGVAEVATTTGEFAAALNRLAESPTLRGMAIKRGLAHAAGFDWRIPDL